MILSFVGLVWYCVKGFNLMVGFAVMATFWTVLALIGNAISPTDIMEGQTLIDSLTYVYATGPANYASSILVNVFFGAFFGRVLMDTGIAATLIRKVVELEETSPELRWVFCALYSYHLYVHDRYGPVISIAVIVLPILLSLGIPAPIAMFSFMALSWLVFLEIL